MVQATRFLIPLFLFFLVIFYSQSEKQQAFAEENPFPLLPGLEEAVEFWKLIFTRFGASELVFYDAEEPTKIYRVLEAEESSVRAIRRLVAKEREKIMFEYGLGEDEGRIRAQRGVRERFATGLKLSRRYIDQMKRIFAEEGLPVDLTYLPLVESSFNLQARSRSGAVGIWQFIPSTGRRFLRISGVVDERKDPLESTRAAARFLKHNYDAFGNWPLALTAYNYGREGMLRAVAEVGSTDLMEIIQSYRGRSFGFATKSFYAEFLAAVEVAKRSDEYFPKLEYHDPFPLEELELKRSVSLAALIGSTDITRSAFLEWNPALNPRITDIHLPRGYRVKVPPDKLEVVSAAYQRIVGGPAIKGAVWAAEDAVAWILHQVARGETLSEIARTYQVPVDEIQRLNDLPSVHAITAGKQLKIPQR